MVVAGGPSPAVEKYPNGASGNLVGSGRMLRTVLVFPESRGAGHDEGRKLAGFVGTLLGLRSCVVAARHRARIQERQGRLDVHCNLSRTS